MRFVQRNKPDSSGRPAVIHAVRHSIAEPEWLDTWPAGEARTRIVVIGEYLPRYFPFRLLTAMEEEVREELTAPR